MSVFRTIGSLPPQQIWGGVVGRVVSGERITFSVVELEPGIAIPEHRHENEQVGMIVRGTLTFSIAGETRELGPGDAWCITQNLPHSVVTGPEGAIVLEAFSPVRDDWAGLEPAEPREPLWP